MANTMELVRKRSNSEIQNFMSNIETGVGVYPPVFNSIKQIIAKISSSESLIATGENDLAVVAGLVKDGTVSSIANKSVEFTNTVSGNMATQLASLKKLNDVLVIKSSIGVLDGDPELKQIVMMTRSVIEPIIEILSSSLALNMIEEKIMVTVASMFDPMMKMLERAYIENPQGSWTAEAASQGMITKINNNPYGNIIQTAGIGVTSTGAIGRVEATPIHGTGSLPPAGGVSTTGASGCIVGNPNDPLSALVQKMIGKSSTGLITGTGVQNATINATPITGTPVGTVSVVGSVGAGVVCGGGAVTAPIPVGTVSTVGSVGSSAVSPIGGLNEGVGGGLPQFDISNPCGTSVGATTSLLSSGAPNVIKLETPQAPVAPQYTEGQQIQVNYNGVVYNAVATARNNYWYANIGTELVKISDTPITGGGVGSVGSQNNIGGLQIGTVSHSDSTGIGNDGISQYMKLYI